MQTARSPRVSERRDIASPLRLSTNLDWVRSKHQVFSLVLPTQGPSQVSGVVSNKGHRQVSYFYNLLIPSEIQGKRKRNEKITVALKYVTRVWLYLLQSRLEHSFWFSKHPISNIRNEPWVRQAGGSTSSSTYTTGAHQLLGAHLSCSFQGDKI
jgi:hypothetical protein